MNSPNLLKYLFTFDSIGKNTNHIQEGVRFYKYLKMT